MRLIEYGLIYLDATVCCFNYLICVFVLLTLLAGEDELTSVHALGGSNNGVHSLVSVRILELDTRHRSTSPRVVHDFLDDALDVAMALGIVLSLVAHSALAAGGVRSEDGSLSSTATSNYLSHGLKVSNLNDFNGLVCWCVDKKAHHKLTTLTSHNDKLTTR